MNVVPAVKTDPITSLFSSIQTSFKGLGVQLRLIEGDIDQNLAIKLNSLPLQFARIIVGMPDPSPTVLNIEKLTDMDSIFLNAPMSQGGGGYDMNGDAILSPAQKFFAAVKNANLRLVFSFLAPPSWLLSDGSGQLTGDQPIRGFANYIVSGLLWARTFGVPVTFVEPFYNPDDETSPFGWISSTDLQALITQLRSLLIQRIPSTSPSIQILAPCPSSVPALSENYYDVYLNSMLNVRNSIDAWALHTVENTSDLDTVNLADEPSREYLSDRLNRWVSQAKSINLSLPIYSTGWSTRANRFPMIKISDDAHPTVVDYVVEEGVDKVADLEEYAVRCVENLCSIMENGVSFAIYDGGLSTWRRTITTTTTNSTTGDVTTDESIIYQDDKALFTDLNDLRPIGSLMQFLLSNMPIPGDVYISEEFNPTGDLTKKLLVMTSTADRFLFILSRPVLPDQLNGVLRLVIENPLWSTSYQATDLTITSFPDAMSVKTITQTDADGKETDEQVTTPGVDTSQIIIRTTFAQGTLKFDLKHVPYGGCLLFFTGKVSLIPPTPPPDPTPPAPIPTPNGGTGTPVVISTIIQVPVNYGEPNRTDYADGTVFYDSKQKTLKTWLDGSWFVNMMMEYT
jgi:hypothetical protein